MKHVDHETAEKIRLCVERLQSGSYEGCPSIRSGGIVEWTFCPTKYRGMENKDRCPKCWRESCLAYIRDNAPKNFVVGDKAILIDNASCTGGRRYPVGSVGKVEDLDKFVGLRFHDGYYDAYSYDRVRRISDLEQPEWLPQVGDVVRGKKGTGHFIGTENMTKGKILYLNGDTAKVLIIEHLCHEFIGREFAIRGFPEDFVKIGHEQPEQKEESEVFKFGDVVKGVGDFHNFFINTNMKTGIIVGRKNIWKVMVVEHNTNRYVGGRWNASDESFRKIGRVDCSEETLRHLIETKNVDAIKAMIKLDEEKEVFNGADDVMDSMVYAVQGIAKCMKEDKPMEIKDNKLTLNGNTTKLTDEQMKQLGFEPKKKSVFDRVECGSSYVFNDAQGMVDGYIDERDDTDNDHYNTTNYFADTPEGRAVAHQFAMHQELWSKLTKFATENGGVPRVETCFWNIRRKDNGTFFPDGWAGTFILGSVRFESRKTCQRAIDEVLLPYLASHPDFEW